MVIKPESWATHETCRGGTQPVSFCCPHSKYSPDCPLPTELGECGFNTEQMWVAETSVRN